MCICALRWHFVRVSIAAAIAALGQFGRQACGKGMNCATNRLRVPCVEMILNHKEVTPSPRVVSCWNLVSRFDGRKLKQYRMLDHVAET